MPTVIIKTNVDRTVCNQGFQKKISRLISEIYENPIMYITVTIHHNPKLIFAGTQDPAAFMEIKTVNGTGKKENKAASKAISELLKTELGVLPERFYIYFNTIQLKDVGVLGGTLDGQ
ncbi:Macrophage migration inhibitory factor [Trichoplax sp. H2]|nr:Macrophage migration inhibitory factor [Trichoplax sp. H2]|eukprot:RDD45339.1 Macrophage migration inhibitory factor [Trichoplax sp. H2]